MEPGKALIKERPDDTGIIVIVPSFDEEAITDLLDSLGDCEKAPCTIEVIAGVNAPPGATVSQLTQNRISLEEIESWKEGKKNPPFRLFSVDLGQGKTRHWGAGMARKALMDEALLRFDLAGNEEGIIVSLDADCRVSKNYLTEIYKRFSSDRKVNGSSIRFEHQIPSPESDPAPARCDCLLRTAPQVLLPIP
ncbi:MAG: hypothetical protein R2744_11510 [Bacteroidales bacterium]